MIKTSSTNKNQIFTQIIDNTILIHQDSMESMNFNSCNSYLIKFNDKYAIIDPGCSRRKLNSTLKTNKIHFSDLKYFYITHGHSDHVALIDYLRKKNNQIEGYIHELDKKYVENVKEYYNMLFDLSLIKRNKKYEDFLNAIEYYTTPSSSISIKQGFKMVFDIWNVKKHNIDHTFKDGDVLPGNLKVIHAPGHTPGMCFFYDEKNKILFSSDIHLSTIGGTVSGNAGSFNEFKKSIEKVKRMMEEGKINLILSGHGKNPIMENIKGKIEKFYNTIISKETLILELIKTKDIISLEEITTETFKTFLKRVEKYLIDPNFRDTVIIAEASEMMTNLKILEELEKSQKIKRISINNQEYWTLN